MKYLWLWPLLLAVCISLHAQKFNAGLFGGVTASQVDGDSYSGFNKLGMTAGAFVNRLIDYQIYWQMEIKYVTRGVYKGPTDNDQTLYGSTYHYVELPLSVHYLYDERIQVEAGTSPEVLITTRFWDQDGTIDPATYPDNRRIGLSVFGGLCYWFNPSLGAGIRYTYSAIPFRDPQEWNHPRYRGYFHNVLCLTLAYKLMHP
jgi:hypothetical protein